ncbi:TonB-dependent receptor [Gilvimarinus agarilyticus]|uniref:SusC/RagA family TonB-linked outer membrane protein n=1 Tax=Reichenbachiella agariperforans TaxID=156994 RepID=UPI001C09F110|nr:TonB-dependent receptor [Reichenbachiella agariperforans]MBU2887955.1 TonB-dependent receptor [Gilvimarinus agarilyticus]MBU2913403.1 TonB-dependent receptor [Reichenbachiella agariperforans]
MKLQTLQLWKRSVRPLMILSLSLLWSFAQAQDTTVKGQVKDETGETLPGVSILIKGTTKGTVTDLDGNYSITVSDQNAVLSFSFIGYITQEVAVGSRSTVDVSLQADVQSLEEVVVIGYGEQKKSLSTGAISSVKAQELQTVSTGRIDQALQGRTAGVSIRPTSGSPGSSTKIRIRGISSNGGSDPLFIIDGVRTGAGGMDYLSPNDVESIEVLKDAASAAIYGAEGANGVIIVTTKKGKPNTGVITYSGQYGVQSAPPNMMDMMDAQQYQKYMEAAAVPGAPVAADVDGIGSGTNWLDEMTEDAPQQSHTLSFSGGTEKSTYFISGTMFQQDGIIGGDKARFNRYTARLNSNHKLKDWLTVGENLSYSYIDRSGLAENDEFGGLVASGLALDPITPVTYSGTPYPTHVQTAIDNGQPLTTDANGNYYGLSQFVKGEYGNPLSRINLQKGRTVQNKILGNVFAEINPIEGLKITSRVGIDAAFQRNHNWNPTYWFSSESLNPIANGSDEWQEWYTWQWENFASYDKTIGDHHFNALIGTAIQKYTYNNLNGSYSGLFKEEDKWSYGDYTPDDTDRIGSRPEYRALSSYYGRLAYDYQGKYLMNATLRRDGSSMLSEGNQWGTFPSVSLGWVFSSENFFPSAVANVVNYAKIRASWGQNGSLSNLSPGQWQSAIATSVQGVIRYENPDGTFVQGAAPSNLINPELTWETSEQIDIGLEAKMFDGRLTFAMDYYQKKTKDLITPGAAPFFAGNKLNFTNAGDVLNKGFEFELGFNNSSSNDFQYGINLNFSTLTNEVTYLDPNYPTLNGSNVGTGWTGATRFEEGYPVWYFNGYKTDGIFQNQTEIDDYIAQNGLSGYAPVPGDPIVMDTNEDGTISLDDQTYIGDAIPDYFFGARVNLAYKGFDLLVFAQGQAGNEVLMGFNRTDRPTANKPALFYEDMWTGDGSTNSWFRPNTNSNIAYSSDYMVFDGSFVKIRQMQLGYTLPTNVADAIKVSNVRFYVSLDNFFTFTKYPGMDPEAGSSGDNSQGVDRGYYPVPRTVIGGLTFSF